jgi:hypothetical protein
MWKTGKKAFRVALAGMPGPGPASLRKKMATDQDRDVRLATMRYLTVHVSTHLGRRIREALTLMARDSEVEIRAGVARDYRIDNKIIGALSRDAAWEVRHAILKFHPGRVTSDLGLLREANAEARREAASTLLSRCWGGETVLCRKASERAARDPDGSVRLLVAESPYSTCSALAFLIEDPEEAVRQALAERPSFCTWCKTARVTAGIGLRAPKPARVAANSKNPALRAMAAGMRSTGRQMLQDLSQDRSWFVRLAVAGNPKVDNAILERLAKDSNGLVRERARSRVQQP